MAIHIRDDVCAQSLKLSATNILQVLALRPSCGGLVQIHRYAMPLPDLSTGVASDGDTVLQRDAFDRDERHNISGANARMSSLMMHEVDQLCGLTDAANCCFGNRIAISNQCDDAAVVICVH